MAGNILTRIAALEVKLAPVPNRFNLFCQQLQTSMPNADYEAFTQIDTIPEPARTPDQRAIQRRLTPIYDAVFDRYTIEQLEQILADYDDR